MEVHAVVDLNFKIQNARSRKNSQRLGFSEQDFRVPESSVNQFRVHFLNQANTLLDTVLHGVAHCHVTTVSCPCSVLTGHIVSMESTRKKRLLRLSILGNFLGLIILCVLVIVFRDPEGTYIRFGPSTGLFLLSVLLDTWPRYFAALGVICALSVSDILVNEIANPILGFSIYNPDKRVIKGFTRNELQAMANTHFAINSIRWTMSVVISVTQIDLALFSAVFKEATTFFTIRYLLNQKEFTTETDDIPLQNDSAV
jgi:hypothetical protein